MNVFVKPFKRFAEQVGSLSAKCRVFFSVQSLILPSMNIVLVKQTFPLIFEVIQQLIANSFSAHSMITLNYCFTNLTRNQKEDLETHWGVLAEKIPVSLERCWRMWAEWHIQLFSFLKFGCDWMDLNIDVVYKEGHAALERIHMNGCFEGCFLTPKGQLHAHGPHGTRSCFPSWWKIFASLLIKPMDNIRGVRTWGWFVLAV